METPIFLKKRQLLSWLTESRIEVDLKTVSWNESVCFEMQVYLRHCVTMVIWYVKLTIKAHKEDILVHYLINLPLATVSTQDF